MGNIRTQFLIEENVGPDHHPGIMEIDVNLDLPEISLILNITLENFCSRFFKTNFRDIFEEELTTTWYNRETLKT